MRLAVFCDFDETITKTNVTDAVLERFADPLWLEIQDDWLAGKLGAREVLEKQMPLITAKRKDLDAFIDSVELDPFFPDFAEFCAGKRYPIYILSDGFDYWIDRILCRALSGHQDAYENVPYFACGLKFEGSRVAISFPYFAEGCIHGCATCKPALFDRLKAGADKAVVIGDGVSDLLLAENADLVLAKNGLREFCRKKGIPHHGFKNFRDVLRIIESLGSNNDD
jgi:2-hydroxy-3-keto-5-methylthiopentenyl-1-phosphate phosphatase